MDETLFIVWADRHGYKPTFMGIYNDKKLAEERVEQVKNGYSFDFLEIMEVILNSPESIGF